MFVRELKFVYVINTGHVHVWKLSSEPLIWNSTSATTLTYIFEKVCFQHVLFSQPPFVRD